MLYFLKNKIKTNFFPICLVVSKIIITFAPTTNETPVSLVNQERWMLHESQNIVITKLPTELLKQMLIMEIPNNPTNHVAAQQYRMKSSIEEYEANA